MGEIEKILENEKSQDLIVDISEILLPIFDNDPDDLSNEELNIILIENLEREVNNGGFNSFFWNTWGDMTEETMAALIEVGSVTFRELLDQAIQQFPDGYVPADTEERQNIIEEIEEDAEEVWNDLDDEFYEYNEDLYGLMIDYIKRNIDKFR
ncbi:MAG: DMP19 family protein [Eubacteriaceae bacterium]|nr:DMP19 family protein [Eubacteriaceae bacterium]